MRLTLTKFDGSLHRAVDVDVLGDDEHGRWLFEPKGSSIAGANFQSRWNVVHLVPVGAAWTAAFFDVRNDDGHADLDIYIDIVEPVSERPDEIVLCDLDLDVVRWLDGSVAELDRDEFDDHARLYGYSTRLVVAANRASAEVLTLLRGEHEPFRTAGWNWLARSVH